MWTPPERMRHAIGEAHWPSREEAARARLFAPLESGRLALAERTWVPAMVPWRASDEGFVTPAVLEWYERLARGAPGAIVVEATGIRDVPSGPLLRIGDDRFVPGLADLVRRVRAASGGRTRLFIQLIDFLRIRRRPSPERYFGELLAVREEHRLRFFDAYGVKCHLTQDTPDFRRALLAAELSDPTIIDRVLAPRELEGLRFGARERVTDVELPHVRELPRVLPPLFADAAARAEAAGFDGVELHYAHAYTMASFLSATNSRDDGYGGPREHRVRLPREVLASVRARVGARFVVGARLLCDEIVEGGSGVDDAAWFATELSRAGSDFVSLSTGGKFDDAKRPEIGAAAYPYTGRSGYECMPTVLSDARGPFGRNLAKMASVRAAIRAAGLATPTVVAGGIHDFEQAEAILARGDGDVVAAARQSLADPDWFRKMRLGRGREIRRCSYTNYCEALDQRHKAVTCRLWDREGLDEPGASRTVDGKRRLVAPPWNEAE
jgi:2,4-dienoyl-CoA reductase-like NADH-dependent reductase (Old Yellow Enzyme family)